MENVTVTMPLQEFEIMRSQIEALRERDVRQFVKLEGIDVLTNGPAYNLDLDALVKFLKSDYPNLKVELSDSHDYKIKPTK